MSLLDDYLVRTPRSRELFERATGSLPGGSTRTTVYTAPYPPYIESGAGLHLRDVDGNVYRDFLGNYTSLILGHAHPAVVAAVEAQVRRGSAFAAPTEAEVELAEEIRRRIPSIDRLRFTNSGTEATMFAIRAARAFTGRPLIAKFDRSYHGTHDAVMTGTPGVPEAMAGLVVSSHGATSTASKRCSKAARATLRGSSSSRSRARAASGSRSPPSWRPSATTPSAMERC
jgi:glutamate-1-semialdehyde 2,1-aminomutase